jgi:hypothetical protein
MTEMVRSIEAAADRLPGEIAIVKREIEDEKRRLA